MSFSVLIVALLPAVSTDALIHRPVVERQNEVFRRWWNDDFVWKFDKLPEQGKVPAHRVPYSGYIYPDRFGGTSSALHKYDRAFSRGYAYPATAWEKWDTTAYKEPTEGLLGLFGATETPDWHGHCNGWAAAAMRHAPPQRTVQSNGVVFTPSDIRALLAEIYIYNDTEILDGLDRRLNAGTFHAILANWLGRGSHPVGMDKDPGEEKWNYPIYAYASAYVKRSPREIEVNTNIRYAQDMADGERDESPQLSRVLFFHYSLYLNERGEIIGGRYFRDSAAIDMCWVPLQPKQPGEEGHEIGNPHVDVEKVLALWRKSVPEESRNQWVNIDPPEKDRMVSLAQQPSLIPRGMTAVALADSDARSTGEQPSTQVPAKIDVPPAVVSSETPAAEADETLIAATDETPNVEADDTLTTEADGDVEVPVALTPTPDPAFSYRRPALISADTSRETARWLD